MPPYPLGAGAAALKNRMVLLIFAVLMNPPDPAGAFAVAFIERFPEPALAPPCPVRGPEAGSPHKSFFSVEFSGIWYELKFMFVSTEPVILQNRVFNNIFTHQILQKKFSIMKNGIQYSFNYRVSSQLTKSVLYNRNRSPS